MEKERKLYILLVQLLSWYEEAIFKVGSPPYELTMLERYHVAKYYMDILLLDYRKVKARKPNTPPSTVAAKASKYFCSCDGL